MASAGYYGIAVAGSVPAPVNQSTRAYPRPGFAWVSMQNERETGASVYVEGYAAHRHAQGGRQVACVKYDARDGQGNVSPAVISASPVLSALQMRGQRVEVYPAQIAQTALANGERCRVNARVYPWMGDESAVLDLIEHGVGTTGAATSANAQTPLRFVCDRTGGYGGGKLYVRPTGTLTAASTAGVFTSLQNGPALTNGQCYPSIDAALGAAQAFNAGARGHNDFSGVEIFLTDDGAGGAVAHTIAANISGRAAGLCWADIRPDPTATGAVTLSLSLAATNRAVPRMLRFAVDIVQNAGTLDGGSAAPADHAIAFIGNVLNAAGAAAPVNFRHPLCYMRDVTVKGIGNVSASPFTASANTTLTKVAQMVGVTCQDATVNVAVRGYALLGCQFRRCYFDELDTISFAAFETQDGCVIANTVFGQVIDAGARMIGRSRPIARGYWVIQNVWEATRTVNGNFIFGVACDNSVQPVDNVVLMHNSFPATDITGRCNFLYMDEAADAGIVKRAHFRGNIFGQWNSKADTFTDNTSVAGRTGNWSARYGVGQEGNVCTGDTGGNTATSPDAAPTHRLGEARTPSNKLNATPATLTYVDQKAGLGAAGGGNYRLTGTTNDAYGRVAAGQAALAFDLAGAARLNDGTGAAGAYERSG